MENYLIRLQYIGNRFYGFQKQPGLLTVQGAVEEALSIIFQEKINTVGSARTDRGVNALNQYMNFYTNKNIEQDYLKRKMNSILFRKGICIKDISNVDLNFHARKSAKEKVYAYIISQKPLESMFMLPYVYFYNEVVNYEFFNIAAKGLLGKHDFSIFANIDRSQHERDTFCEMRRIDLEDRGNYFLFYFSGDRFLYHMVRRMVYYLLKASSGHIDEGVLQDPFSSKKVPFTRQVLPPEPLFLVNVLY